jgi:hypothetical protein
MTSVHMKGGSHSNDEASNAPGQQRTMVPASVKGVTFASVHPPTTHLGPPYTLANPRQSESHSKAVYGPSWDIGGHGSAAAYRVL